MFKVSHNLTHAWVPAQARRSVLWRSAWVALTLLGWCVLSNHCALGRLAEIIQAQPAHACCQKLAQDLDPNENPHAPAAPCPGTFQGACCQSLHALLPGGFEGIHPATDSLLAILPETCWVPGFTSFSRVLTPSTGPPPRALSFSELVLHRSLRANAPPRRA